MSENIQNPTNDENEMDVDVQDDEVFNDDTEGNGAQDSVNNNGEGEEEEKEDGEGASKPNLTAPELPEFTRKDKTLHEILEMMEDYYPIVSFAVISYKERVNINKIHLDTRCCDGLLSC